MRVGACREGALWKGIPGKERRAVWLEAQAAERRVWLRALPNAEVLDIWHAMLDWLAIGNPSIPRKSEADPGAARPIRMLCTGTGGIELALDAKLGSALRASRVLCFRAGKIHAVVKACEYVDATGMESGVEVVGKKYTLIIPEFTSPPFFPTPLAVTRANRRTAGASRIEAG